MVYTPNFADALTSSGTYSFVFRISVDGSPAPGTINGFKLRTNRNISLRGQSIQFIAKVSFPAERNIVYPGLPAGTCPAANQPTTYDGTWEFSFNVPEGTTRLELWDGEMDFGSADGTTKDTDDPNTPATGVCQATGGTPAQCDPSNPDIPLWAQGTAAVAEGCQLRARARHPMTTASSSPQCLFLRPPSLTYRLIPPSDQVRSSTIIPRAPWSGRNSWFPRTRMTLGTCGLQAGRHRTRHLDTPHRGSGRFQPVCPSRRTTVVPPDGVGQGCSPGYWKQPQHLW